jgi:hypothetical protein
MKVIGFSAAAGLAWNGGAVNLVCMSPAAAP